MPCHHAASGGAGKERRAPGRGTANDARRTMQRPEYGARFDPDDNKPQSHAKSTRPAATNPAGLSGLPTGRLMLLLLPARTAFAGADRRLPMENNTTWDRRRTHHAHYSTPPFPSSLPVPSFSISRRHPRRR